MTLLCRPHRGKRTSADAWKLLTNEHIDNASPAKPGAHKDRTGMFVQSPDDDESVLALWGLAHRTHV